MMSMSVCCVTLRYAAVIEMAYDLLFLHASACMCQSVDNMSSSLPSAIVLQYCNTAIPLPPDYIMPTAPPPSKPRREMGLDTRETPKRAYKPTTTNYSSPVTNALALAGLPSPRHALPGGRSCSQQWPALCKKLGLLCRCYLRAVDLPNSVDLRIISRIVHRHLTRIRRLALHHMHCSCHRETLRELRGMSHLRHAVSAGRSLGLRCLLDVSQSSPLSLSTKLAYRNSYSNNRSLHPDPGVITSRESPARLLPYVYPAQVHGTPLRLPTITLLSSQ